MEFITADADGLPAQALALVQTLDGQLSTIAVQWISRSTSCHAHRLRHSPSGGTMPLVSTVSAQKR